MATLARWSRLAKRVQAVHLSSRTHPDAATLDDSRVLVAAEVDVVFLAGYMQEVGLVYGGARVGLMARWRMPFWRSELAKVSPQATAAPKCSGVRSIPLAEVVSDLETSRDQFPTLSARERCESSHPIRMQNIS